MSEVNYNYVIDAICKALSEEFPDKAIFTDTVEQGFTPGSFFVSLLRADNKRFRWNRFTRTHHVSVQYMPESDRESEEECWRVAESARNALTWIKVGGNYVEGTEYNSEITDGVLTVTVTYKFLVDEEIETDPTMGSHSASVGVNVRLRW